MYSTNVGVKNETHVYLRHELRRSLGQQVPVFDSLDCILHGVKNAVVCGAMGSEKSVRRLPSERRRW